MKKENKKLVPAQHWKWRYFISEMDRAKAELKAKKEEQTSFSLQTKIFDLGFQLKGFEVRAKEAELELTEKNYKEIKDELEKSLGMKLDNHSVTETGEIKPLGEEK